MPFDPDEYLKKKASGFDPDAYITAKSEIKKPDATMLESGISGLADIMTFGHSDEIAAGGQALIDKLKDGGDYSELYKKNRDVMRGHKKKMEADNPGTYKTAQVVGGIGTALASGGLGAVGNTQRALGLATGGGALAGSGYSEGEIGSGQHALDTGLGAGLGAVTFGLGKAGEKVIKGTGKILADTPMVKTARNWTADKLADVAAMRAAKAAIGQNKKMAKEIAAKPGGLLEFGRKLIGTKLDSGKKVLSFGNTTDAIGEKAIQKVDELGPQYNEIFKQVDELAPEGAVSPNAIADQIMGKADQEFGQVANRGVKDRLYKEAEGFMDMPKNLTMQAAQKEKNAYKWTPKKGLPSPEELRPDLQNQMKNIVGDQMDAGIEKFGGKELAERYSNLNKDFGHIKTVANAAEDRATQDFTNRMISPTDYAAAATTFLQDIGKGSVSNMLSGGKAAIAGALHNQVRTRGNASTAVTMDALSKALKSMPEAFGKYGGVLAKANEKGAANLGMTHHVLWKNDPEYRALFSIDRSEEQSMSAKPLGSPGEAKP